MRRAAVSVMVAAALSVALAQPATAHPLGNFTVNTYAGLQVGPGHITVDYVLDLAEIPALQEQPEVERAGALYGDERCQQLAASLTVEAAGTRLPLVVDRADVSFPPGQAGLSTLRLECRYGAAVDLPADIVFEDANLTDRVGWREITAVGDGATLTGSDVATATVTERLVRYPEEATSPLRQLTASFSAEAGGDRAGGAGAATSGEAQDGENDRFARLFTSLPVDSQGFGIVVAMGLAALLGGLHALAPGHGKTLMAAYVIGRHGGLREVGTIGATVALTHTAGVLALGVLIWTSEVIAPDQVLPYLQTLSGVLLVIAGSVLLQRRLRGQHGHVHLSLRGPVAMMAGVGAQRDGHVEPSTAPDHQPALHQSHGEHHGHSHDHHDHHDHHADPHRRHASHAHQADHDHHDHHGHGADHDHPAGHAGHDHVHDTDEVVQQMATALSGRAPASTLPSRRALILLGIAGGLVPTPSALVVLLGALALGRAWLGVVLVGVYGVGMAAILMGTGLALVRLQSWIEARWWERRWLVVAGKVLPVLTAGLLILGGVSLVVRAASGL